MGAKSTLQRTLCPFLTVQSHQTLDGDENGNINFAYTSPLSSLCPLRLPASVCDAYLWFRLASCRRSLTVDAFTGMGHVKELAIHVVADFAVVTKEGLEHLCFSLGPTLSSLSSLTCLSLSAEGTLRGRVGFVLPDAFSCLSSLQSFFIHHSTGENTFSPIPPHWSRDGLAPEGQDLRRYCRASQRYCRASILQGVAFYV